MQNSPVSVVRMLYTMAEFQKYVIHSDGNRKVVFVSELVCVCILIKKIHSSNGKFKFIESDDRIF